MIDIRLLRDKPDEVRAAYDRLGGTVDLTRVIAAVESLQLVCKVVKVQPGAKAVRVNLLTPKAKE